MTFLQQLTSNPLQAIIFLLAIIVAITVHEFAHAWVATYFGDPTPDLQGRLTLSPLAHLDPLGSLAFLLFGFGWGKPVIYNPIHFKRDIDELWVALAGPVSNILLAILFNILLLFTVHIANPNVALVLNTLIEINVILAAFNLLPFPPLDGSAIVAYFWPPYRSPRITQISSLLLIAILLLLPGVLDTVLTPIITLITRLTTLFGLLP